MSSAIRRSSGGKERPGPVPAAYGMRLKEAAITAGLGWESVAKMAGVSTVTAWRVTKGEGTIEAAQAIYDALRKRKIPVPSLDLTIGERPAEIEQWAALGRRLLERDPAAFHRALGQMRRLVEAHELVESGIRLISDPMPSNPDE